MLLRTGIVCVLLTAYLTVIGMSAHAFFSFRLYADGNVIGAARFAVTVSVTDEEGAVPPVVQTNGITNTLTLLPGKTYTVTLSPDGTAQTGFCIITAKNCVDKYHTQPLQVYESATDFVFYLSVTEAEVIAHWGSADSYPLYTSDDAREAGYIRAGETVTLTVTATTSAPSETTASASTKADEV
ncbi:MAG: hypothetical protein IJF42_02860 [Clostridia bacterium]|nr:hypothetical protein [Clostridia bacterium]